MKDLFLLESLKIFDGEIFHLDLHNKRMNYSRKKLFGSTDFIDLKDYLKIPLIYQKGLIKCKVTYGEEIQKITFTFYKKRNIKKLRIIHCNEIDYSFKYANRSIFEKLTQSLSLEEEILIVKNGFITDTSYSNVILWEKNLKKWFTPSTPLLKGTQRKFLLKKKKIFEKKIKLSDLKNYSHIQLINAMLDIDKNIIKINI